MVEFVADLALILWKAILKVIEPLSRLWVFHVFNVPQVDPDHALFRYDSWVFPLCFFGGKPKRIGLKVP